MLQFSLSNFKYIPKNFSQHLLQCTISCKRKWTALSSHEVISVLVKFCTLWVEWPATAGTVGNLHVEDLFYFGSHISRYGRKNIQGEELFFFHYCFHTSFANGLYLWIKPTNAKNFQMESPKEYYSPTNKFYMRQDAIFFYFCRISTHFKAKIWRATTK